MSPSLILRSTLLASVALPLIASAQTPPLPMPAGALPAGEHRGPPPGMPMLPELRGVKLTEAQQDKVFQIMHEQATALYEATKTAQRADAELHALSLAPKFDTTRARVLADAAGRAQGEIAFLHASTSARIFALLTPEQRRLQPEEGRRPQPPRP